MMSENQLGCFYKHPKEEWWWLSQGGNNGKKTSDSVYILEVEPKGYCWLKVQCERRKESRMTPGFYLEQLERPGCYFTEMLSFRLECSWKIPWCLLRTLGVEKRVSRPPAESQQASEGRMSMNSHGWMGKRESEKVASLREFSPRKVEETSWNSTRPHLFPLPTPHRNLWRLRWAELKIPWAGLGIFWSREPSCTSIPSGHLSFYFSCGCPVLSSFSWICSHENACFLQGQKCGLAIFFSPAPGILHLFGHPPIWRLGKQDENG